MSKKIIALLAVMLLLAVCAAATAETQTVVRTNAKADVYKSADVNSTKLGTLKKGTYLALIAVKGDWAKVTLNGNTGYMYKGYLTETTMPAYVNELNVTIYKSNKTSSKKLGTLGFGSCVNLIATSGGWAKVSLDGAVGFCKYDKLTLSDNNTISVTIYAQEKSVPVYQCASTSSKVLGTMSRNSKLTAVFRSPDGKWVRVRNGKQYGYALAEHFATTKHDGYSTAKCASGQSVEMDWWKSNIRTLFARGGTAIVTDVATGITWRVYRGGGTNHADVQPLTSEDTAAMKKACGVDYGTWERRAIWVTIGDKKIAASMNCMPHGDGSISDNDFNGHYCIHFTNSRTHGTDSICPLHQACVKKALKAG